MNKQKIICDCGHLESECSDFTRGYGKDEHGKTSCYECCAEKDKAYMRENGKTCLYLTYMVKSETGMIYGARVSNWPGSLSIPVHSVRVGKHNIARTRYDVRFSFEGATWRGVQYGENTQICHCKRLKVKA